MCVCVCVYACVCLGVWLTTKTEHVCKDQRMFGPFISFNVRNIKHTHMHIFVPVLWVAVCMCDCVTALVQRGIWGPGNCVEITLGFLWLILESWESTLTKNNRAHACCRVTTPHFTNSDWTRETIFKRKRKEKSLLYNDVCPQCSSFQQLLVLEHLYILWVSVSMFPERKKHTH